MTVRGAAPASRFLFSTHLAAIPCPLWLIKHPLRQATLVMEEVPPLPGSELSPARARQSMVLEARRSMMLESRSKSRLMPESRKSMVVGARAHRHVAELDTSFTTCGPALYHARPWLTASMYCCKISTSADPATCSLRLPGRLPRCCVICVREEWLFMSKCCP